MEFASIKAITIDAIGTVVAPTPSVGVILANCLQNQDVQCDWPNLTNSLQEAFEYFYEAAAPSRKVEGVTDRTEKLFWGKIFAKILGELFPRAPDAFLKKMVKAFWEAMSRPENWEEIPGARPPLELLSRCGYKIYIFSNGDSRLHKILKGLGLSSIAEAAFVATELGYRKPHPQAFAKVMSALRLPPEAFLHVSGDREEDVLGAMQAGWSGAFLHASSPKNKSLLHVQRLGDLVERLMPSDRA